MKSIMMMAALVLALGMGGCTTDSTVEGHPPDPIAGQINSAVFNAVNPNAGQLYDSLQSTIDSVPQD